MTVEQLTDLFIKLSENHDESYRPRDSYMITNRGDLNAFILINRLCPKRETYRGLASDIVSAAVYDKIFLDCDLEKLAPVASEDDVKALDYFGVFVDDDSLSMFV